MGSVEELFRSAVLLLLTPQCYDKFFVEFDFFDGPCLKAAISKGLGLGIIAGSLLVKVPQIVKLLNARSAEGISFMAVLLELCAITSSFAYSFVNKYPFSSYGDSVFIAIQTAVIGFLVLWYSGQASSAWMFSAGYVASVTVLTCGITPYNVLWFLQAMVIPLVVSGKMIQVIANYKNQSTGQLSAVTCFLLFFGALARIFTSIQETGDSLIIFTYLVATSVNGVIASQVIYYWNSAKKQA